MKHINYRSSRPPLFNISSFVFQLFFFLCECSQLVARRAISLFFRSFEGRTKRTTLEGTMSRGALCATQHTRIQHTLCVCSIRPCQCEIHSTPHSVVLCGIVALLLDFPHLNWRSDLGGTLDLDQHTQPHQQHQTSV